MYPPSSFLLHLFTLSMPPWNGAAICVVGGQLPWLCPLPAPCDPSQASHWWDTGAEKALTLGEHCRRRGETSLCYQHCSQQIRTSAPYHCSEESKFYPSPNQHSCASSICCTVLTHSVVANALCFSCSSLPSVFVPSVSLN